VARITLDATVLIALAKPDDAHHEWAKEFFLKSTDMQLCIASLTLAEVLVHPVRQKVAKKFLNAINRLNLEVLPLADDDVLGLAQVRVSSGLRMPDAVVLHTAISHKTDIVTTDVQLARAALAHKVAVHQPATTNL
jgi:predicted nucleic acid-binding protein